jgi:hypothetical protein
MHVHVNTRADNMYAVESWLESNTGICQNIQKGIPRYSIARAMVATAGVYSIPNGGLINM